MRQNIEHLFGAHTGPRAGCDVTDGIAAAAASGQANFEQALSHIRRIFDRDLMDLDILPGRYVQHTVAELFA